MRTLAAALSLLAAACGAGAPPVAAPPAPALRLLFGGDVMLGRGAAAVVAAEGADVFAPVRHLIAGADLAAANLESPPTTSPAVTEGHDLRAAPAVAAVLRAAGWDAMALANNHAGDGGPAGLAGAVAALTAAGLATVGAAAGPGDAMAPVVVGAGRLDVALIAVDLTGRTPGVASWDEPVVRDAVAAARAQADLVAVGVHGGAEGLPRPDPVLRGVVERLASWGADVVWAHGAHVVHATEAIDPDADGRPTVAAYGLGDLVFDRAGEGALLEVLAGSDGVRAWRVARTATGDGRVAFGGWEEAAGTAAVVGGQWWSSLIGPGEGQGGDPPATGWLPEGVEVLAAGRGDVTGDGADEVVVAFLRPQRPSLAAGLVDAPLADSRGRTAHLGVYETSGRQVWVAGTLARPVAALAVCDGSLAVGYAALDGTDVEATGAWGWEGFGFVVAPDLPGGGEPGCADVDGDGRRDPVIRRP